MNNINFKTISDLISSYRRLPSQSADREPLYKMILSQVRECFYFIPQECFGMSEEDCAEYLLQNECRIPGLIESYEDSYNDFEAFIFPIVEVTVKGFKKHKAISQRKENSILLTHSGYELQLKEMENSIEDLVVSEAMKNYLPDDNPALQRLRYVFVHYPKSRDRFYIYFISYAILMEPEEIQTYCKIFNFDFKETMKILKYVSKQKNPEDEDLQHAIDKRNEYFGKQLFVETQLSVLNFLADHSKDYEYNEIINRYKRYAQAQDTFIQRKIRRIPRSTMAKIFNKVEGTIANHMFFSKNLIEWCLNPDFVPKAPSLSIGVVEEVLKQALIDENIVFLRSDCLPVLHPFKNFNISSSLNC